MYPQLAPKAFPYSSLSAFPPTTSYSADRANPPAVQFWACKNIPDSQSDDVDGAWRSAPNSAHHGDSVATAPIGVSQFGFVAVVSQSWAFESPRSSMILARFDLRELHA